MCVKMWPLDPVRQDYPTSSAWWCGGGVAFLRDTTSERLHLPQQRGRALGHYSREEPLYFGREGPADMLTVESDTAVPAQARQNQLSSHQKQQQPRRFAPLHAYIQQRHPLFPKRPGAASAGAWLKRKESGSKSTWVVLLQFNFSSTKWEAAGLCTFTLLFLNKA